MSIRKQDFYEGAALLGLARTGLLNTIRHTPPFFSLNNDISVLLKYSTRGRSPWGFTFTAEEQDALKGQNDSPETHLALVCGSDGVATFSKLDFSNIAGSSSSAIRISCFRNHGEHYEVRGPAGTLARKISPSAWTKLLG
jgi:hypothetical protein